MHVFAQHGYGKSDKIEAGIRHGVLKGVILSPRDERPERMSAYVDSLRTEFGRSVAVLLDPQFYASTLPSPRDGYLPEYPYYQPGLSRGRFIAPADIHSYVSSTLAYQATLSLSYMVSPTILIQDFRDPWSQIALSMAQEAMAVHAGLPGAPPLLLSLAVDENALKNIDALNEFLDIVSMWDLTGIYLIVRRSDPGYPAAFEEQTLANLMYLVYVLGEINGFQVICGYSDLMGTLLHAVGATATGAGWFHSLRQFSLSRFEPAKGGRAPRPRYTSASLMNSLLVLPELQTIYRLGYLPSVLSETTHDRVMVNGPANAPWPTSVSCLHHWEVLNRLATTYSSQGSTARNLDALEQAIQQGLGLYQLLRVGGAQFETATGDRDLHLWSRAIRSFRGEVRI